MYIVYVCYSFTLQLLHRFISNLEWRLIVPWNKSYVSFIPEKYVVSEELVKKPNLRRAELRKQLYKQVRLFEVDINDICIVVGIGSGLYSVFRLLMTNNNQQKNSTDWYCFDKWKKNQTTDGSVSY